MEVERVAKVIIESDPDLIKTINLYNEIRNEISEIAFNKGKFLRRIELHGAVYKKIKGRLASQITCTLIRGVAGSYAAVKANGHEIRQPIKFRKPHAMFLMGKRGRDARFMRNGTFSVWTVGGVKKLDYFIPEYFRDMVIHAKEWDSIILRVVNGRIVGNLALTLDIPEVKGINPIGIDLNETNTLVAIDCKGRKLYAMGVERRIRNRKIKKAKKRLQRKLVARKAQHKSTKSVGKVLKRLNGRQERATNDFCHKVVKRLWNWSLKNPILVFEKLDTIRQGKYGSPALNKRLTEWPRAQIVTYATYKFQGKGEVAFVNPAYTSQICSRCGLMGKRSRHKFFCPSCGYSIHSDLNAATNILHRFTSLRASGLPSVSLEASMGGKVLSAN